jgi:hypothetical protein
VIPISDVRLQCDQLGNETLPPALNQTT